MEPTASRAGREVPKRQAMTLVVGARFKRVVHTGWGTSSVRPLASALMFCYVQDMAQLRLVLCCLFVQSRLSVCSQHTIRGTLILWLKKNNRDSNRNILSKWLACSRGGAVGAAASSMIVELGPGPPPGTKKLFVFVCVCSCLCLCVCASHDLVRCLNQSINVETRKMVNHVYEGHHQWQLWWRLAARWREAVSQ